MSWPRVEINLARRASLVYHRHRCRAGRYQENGSPSSLISVDQRFGDAPNWINSNESVRKLTTFCFCQAKVADSFEFTDRGSRWQEEGETREVERCRSIVPDSSRTFTFDVLG